MSVIVGAYAASPAHAVWHPQLEAAFLTGLADLATVRGLELPWTGSIHPHDDGWLLANLPRRFDVVLTSIPGTVGRLAADPRYGLASLDGDGRAAAVAEALRMRDGVRQINDALGRPGVIAVELHSAPAARDGSAAALAASLAELAGADWDGAELLIEHCDAQIAGQPAEKGYLTIEEELEAIAASPAAVGLSINWGRSAIELRGGERVAAQIAAAAATGRLRALVLSGASAVDGPYGPAWTDAHLPLAPADDVRLGEPSSLLTAERVAEALAAAGEPAWVGAKLGWRPADASVAERVEMIAQATRMIAATVAGATVG